MEFRERVDDLSKKYGVSSGQLYDYVSFNLGLKFAIGHPRLWAFDNDEFKNIIYDMTEHQLRNGYLQQNGPRLERIINQNEQLYRKIRY